MENEFMTFKDALKAKSGLFNFRLEILILQLTFSLLSQFYFIFSSPFGVWFLSFHSASKTFNWSFIEKKTTGITPIARDLRKTNLFFEKVCIELYCILNKGNNNSISTLFSQRFLSQTPNSINKKRIKLYD